MQNKTSPVQHRWYVLGVLSVVTLLEWADRALLGALAEPVKEEFGLTDTEMGFLLGFGFVLIRVIVAVPIARLADSWNRRNVLALSLGLWSLMTLVTGYARTYIELAIARAGVGVGTAGSTPSINSIIADLYPLKERGMALSIWNITSYLGFSLGFAAGGFISEFYGWRYAFIFFGAAGLVTAIFIGKFIKEPLRKKADGLVSSAKTIAFIRTLQFMWQQRALRHVLIGMSLVAFTEYTMNFWTASFFIRTHNLSVMEAGSTLSLIYLLAGVPGSYLGGWLMDKLGKRDLRWHAWLIVLILALNAIPSVIQYTAPNFNLVLICMFLSNLLWAAQYSPQYNVQLGLVGTRMRATVLAVIALFIAIVGIGIGPLLTGVLSDYLQPIYGERALGYSLLFSVVIQLWSAVHFLIAAKYIREDYKRVSDSELLID